MFCQILKELYNVEKKIGAEKVMIRFFSAFSKRKISAFLLVDPIF